MSDAMNISREELRQIVREGRGRMPAISESRLSGDDLEARIDDTPENDNVCLPADAAGRVRNIR